MIGETAVVVLIVIGSIIITVHHYIGIYQYNKRKK